MSSEAYDPGRLLNDIMLNTFDKDFRNRYFPYDVGPHKSFFQEQ
ncbi:hypothetical protein Leryth_025411, partial [Lithospermum erythrorhizon]